MSIFVCSVCGHLEFGKAPETCAVCSGSGAKFVQNDNVFKESEEKSKEAAIKHIPSITINKACQLIPESQCVDVIVRIGKAVHPMEAAHYIRFIDCYVDDVHVGRSMLSPGLYAGACFHLKTKGTRVRIVENCNLHGYWQMEGEI